MRQTAEENRKKADSLKRNPLSVLLFHGLKVLRTCTADRAYIVFRKAVALIFKTAENASVFHNFFSFLLRIITDNISLNQL